jgi:hypothetical protein
MTQITLNPTQVQALSKAEEKIQLCDESGNILATVEPGHVNQEHPKPKHMGAFRSGRSDVAERSKDILKEAAKEGQWPS